jgi:hypothetical protein
MTVRAKIRFATFEQAMTNTRIDAAISTSNTVLAQANHAETDDGKVALRA